MGSFLCQPPVCGTCKVGGILHCGNKKTTPRSG